MLLGDQEDRFWGREVDHEKTVLLSYVASYLLHQLLLLLGAAAGNGCLPDEHKRNVFQRTTKDIFFKS